MSRIGKAPITVPSGVDVKIAGRLVDGQGPQGRAVPHDPRDHLGRRPRTATLTVERANDERQVRALHGLTRSLVDNMVTGVTDGVPQGPRHRRRRLPRRGARARTRSSSTLGFSHPVVVDAPDGIEFVVPQPTRIEVHGIDKQLVGQVAANIRAWRKPEPYKGKGVRYVDERVRRKAGKAGK